MRTPALVLGVLVVGGLGILLGTPAAADAPAACTPTTEVSSEVDAGGWDFSESRTGGHHEYAADGLRVWTDGADLSQAKSAGYVATDFALADAGTVDMDVSATSGAAPGINLTIWVDGAWKGNLVHEPLFADWWINKPIPGLPPGPNPSYQLAYGTLDQVVQAYAGHDVRVRAVGYSLGSGAIGDDVIGSITAGCVTHAFSLAPVLAAASPPSPSSTPPPKSAADLLPATEGLATITGDLRPGGDVLVTMPGHAGEQVEIVVFSTAQSLGLHTLDAQASATVTLPADLAAGGHRVAAYSLAGAVVAWAPVAVSGHELAATDDDAAVLAATGTDPVPLELAVAVLLLTGTALVRVSRPSRPSVARHRR